SSEKCFAYLVTDRLNCATLDCWPSQKTIAGKFGWSTKTVHRAAKGLERRGYLTIARIGQGSYRYAPSFLPEDEDKFGSPSGQYCPPLSDKNVGESFLGILSNQSSPSGAMQGSQTLSFNPKKRGLYETEIAKRLGEDGFEILARLSEHDDAIIQRLCRAHAIGKLGDRELDAARLAERQLPLKQRGA